MERSYPKRYGKPSIERHRKIIVEALEYATEDVVVEGEMEADRAELLLIDDASSFPKGITGDPGDENGPEGARAYVLYVDEEFGVVRFAGPLGGGNYDCSPQASQEPLPPTPLTALLRREGIKPGVWVAILDRYERGRTEEGRTGRLIRITRAMLERGRKLSENPSADNLVD
ncbi:MAG: hypothetical protein CYG60_25070 [Actinobacteria bacterium]|nr:MAG: hypothetical protein CYG60_25070 [Actinomycetota bacterium]